METKNAMVRRLVKNKSYKQALSICKDWRGGIAPEDTDILRRGYECMVHPRLYRSMGVNVEKCIEDCIEVLERLYGGKESG